jgi:hypothetical protein
VHEEVRMVHSDERDPSSRSNTSQEKTWDKMILERAVFEASFRQRLLQHPSAAISDVVGEPHVVHMNDSQRYVLAEVLEKAMGDPGFRSELLRDPARTVRALRPELPSNVPEGREAPAFCFMTFIYVGRPE